MTIPNASEDAKKLDLSYTAGVNVMLQPIQKNSWTVFSKIKHTLPIQVSNQTLVYLFQRKYYVHSTTSTMLNNNWAYTNAHSSFIHNNKIWINPNNFQQYKAKHMTSIPCNICCFLVVKSYPTLCDPVNCSMPAFPVLHYLSELLKLMSTELVIPAKHLILCHSLLLPPSFPASESFPLS